MFKSKKCKIEGCNNFVWSEGMCKSHIPKSPLKKSVKINNKKESDEMKHFFLSIWKERKHVSEISGEVLFSPPSTAYFHHILPKSKYPELKFEKDNIILLTLNEHSNVENDIYKYEEVNKRRNQLKIKYNLTN